MSTNKHIDKICCAAIAAAVLVTAVFLNGRSLGFLEVSPVKGYADRLFDTETVHTIDIVMDDWDGFLKTCTREEYAACSVVIDQEAYKDVAIRAKGNTSLMQVESWGNDRYSFKIEFDHYDSGKSYYGLDKLSLNNIIQDNTYMKDYLTYQMMGGFGVDAPLCSYVYITVNGEAWGLYLAVEGVEEAFLERNYGSGYGELYKPDSQDMGGGNGEQNMEDLADGRKQSGQIGEADKSDVSLIYSDDAYESYQNIFDNAKTDVEDVDKGRLIEVLRQLNEGENLREVVDVEEVIRYFVVHNFVCNFDSYTGSMIHNYYLYEEEGMLSMIPWDYNLAFGGFQGVKEASSLVNYPIDTPVSGGTVESRPMLAWIFSEEEYTELYHEYFAEFVSQYFDSGVFAGIIADVRELITPYVEEDPTKFCTFEEFETGAETLEQFCLLRAESIRGQLEGTIASTSDGRPQDGDTLVDASDLDISAMGGMDGGMGMPDDRAGDLRTGQKPEGKEGGTPKEGMQKPEEEEGGIPKEGMQKPEEEEGGIPKEGGFPGDNVPENRFWEENGGNMDAAAVSQDGKETVQDRSWVLVGSSAAVLLAALLGAGLYRKRV